MVSVIVPVYNVENYLRQCIESLLKQTYSNLEIILIDDGSTDKCGEICDEYAIADERIRVFHTENRGISAARNAGLDAAKGDYIGFVDSDDWIEPEMYELLLNAAKQKNADVSVCGSWYEYHSNSEEANINNIEYHGKDCLKALVERKFRTAVWNKLFQRRLFDSVRFPEGRSFEDLAIMHLVFSNVNLVVSVDKLLYHYRQRSNSMVKTYSARVLLDLADAFIDRFKYLEEKEVETFSACENILLSSTAGGLSKVWRWWHKCKKDEKEKYKTKIKDCLSFTKSHFPLFGKPHWPVSLKIPVFFMHSDSKLSFALLYFLNQVYRKIRPKQAEFTE